MTVEVTNPGSSSVEVSPSAEGDRMARAAALIAQAVDEAPPPEATPTEEAAKVEPEAPKVEEVVKEEPPVEAKPKMAKKVVDYSKRETELTAKEKAIAEAQAKIEEREAALKRIRENPSEFLKTHGLTFQEFADAMIAETKVPEPVSRELTKVQKEIEKLRLEREEEKRAAQAAEEKRQAEFIERTTKDYKNHLAKIVEAKKDEYELVHALDATDFAYEIVEEYWLQHEKVMDPEQALGLAEKYLLERAEKMAATKKLQAKKTAKKEPETPKTITSAFSSGSAITSDRIAMSEEEREARAAKLLRFVD